MARTIFKRPSHDLRTALIFVEVAFRYVSRNVSLWIYGYSIPVVLKNKSTKRTVSGAGGRTKGSMPTEVLLEILYPFSDGEGGRDTCSIWLRIADSFGDPGLVAEVNALRVAVVARTICLVNAMLEEGPLRTGKHSTCDRASHLGIAMLRCIYQKTQSLLPW